MSSRTDGTRGRAGLRIAVFLLLFFGLSLLGVWWAAPEGHSVSSAWESSLSLSALRLGVLCFLALLLIGSEMFRLISMGWAFDVHISAQAAFDATVANNFFAWITPGAALGEPAAAYMLGRRGVPWDAAVLVAFGKFVVSFIIIFGSCAVLLALGVGPKIPSWALLSIGLVLALVVLFVSLMLLAAFQPERAHRMFAAAGRFLQGLRFLKGARAQKLVDLITQHTLVGVDRLSKLRETSALVWASVVVSQLMYYGCFVGILVVLADAAGAEPLFETAQLSVVYQGFLYLSPTPGSAGIGEASAGLFFSGVMPGANALVTVVLYRSLTYYLHILLGLIYLPTLGVMRALVGASSRDNH